MNRITIKVEEIKKVKEKDKRKNFIIIDMRLEYAYATKFTQRIIIKVPPSHKKLNFALKNSINKKASRFFSMYVQTTFNLDEVKGDLMEVNQYFDIRSKTLEYDL